MAIDASKKLSYYLPRLLNAEIDLANSPIYNDLPDLETQASLITVANANAFTVGPNGITNPTFNIDTSVANAATGINIQGKAAGSGVLLSVLSSGNNEGLTIAGKGTGAITLQTPTGAAGTVNILPATWNSGSSVQVNFGDTSHYIQATFGGPNFVINSIDPIVIQATGGGNTQNITINPAHNLVYKSGTATPVGGDANSGFLMGSGNVGIYWGSGAPTLSAAQGSLYFRTDGSSTSTRLYVNTNGSTTWTNFTSAA